LLEKGDFDNYLLSLTA